MVTRMFRQFVWTLVAAGATTEVVDISGIMQDIAPKKGYKLHKAQYYCSVSDALATDKSEVYFNMLKNISEAAHHVTPSGAGDLADVRVAGVLFSDFFIFGDSPSGRITPFVKHDFSHKPVEFDANDRMNLELTLNNKDAAQGDVILRMILDVEVL